MKAILYDPQLFYNSDNTTNTHTSIKTTLFDKPFVCHIIDYLVNQGIKDIQILLKAEDNVDMQSMVGNGQRWGINIAISSDIGIQRLNSCLVNAEGDFVIIGSLFTLPEISVKNLPDNPAGESYTVVDRQNIWTGWNFISISDRYMRNFSVIRLFYSHKKQHAMGKIVLPCLSIRSTKEYLNANIDTIKRKNNDIIFPATAFEAEPGVWLSRNVIVHPTAVIKGPAYIGPDTRIDDGAVIGPDVVIEKQCIISKNTRIKKSVICKKSYVGQGLVVKNSVVDQRHLINVNLGTDVMISDPFILGDLDSSTFKSRITSSFRNIFCLAG